MKRMRVSQQELQNVEALLLTSGLSPSSPVTIPFDQVMECLAKQDETRIIWCRRFREFFNTMGVKASVRNRNRTFLFRVIDAAQFEKLCPSTTAVASPSLARSIRDNVLEDGYVLPAYADHVRKSIQANERIMLVGPTGCGKTQLVRALAQEAGADLLRLNLHGDVSAMDLVGQYKISPERTMVFQTGPLVRSMQTPNTWLLLDEIDAAVPQVLFVLQSVLEDTPSLFVPELGERISPVQGWRVMATANTLGKGDESGLYSGTNVLNESFLDRFHSVFLVDYLSPDEETKVILTKVPALDRPLAERMVRVANDLRGALKQGTVYSTFSTRRLIAWALKSVQLGDSKQASVYTVLNRVSPDDLKVFSEVLQRHGF